MTLAASSDFSTPQAAARSLHQAIERADEPAIEAALYAQSDSQKQLARSLAHLMATGRRFQLAARARWGSSADSLVADMTAGDELGQIEKATVKQQAGRAELFLPNATRPIIFLRTNEKEGWRLDIVDYAGVRPARLEQQVTLLRRIAAILSDTTARISAGRYDSPQAVRQEMEKRLNDAMTP